jgi:short-subunit dehydrogenase
MTVLITGASGGLGRAFALDCAERGWDLILTDINAAGLARVRQGIERQYDVNILAKACDIKSDSDVDSLIKLLCENNIRLDMLLNVAGKDYEGGFTQRSFDKITEILRLNIEATLRMTYKALSLRRKSGRFYIIFVSSLASLYPMPLKAAYAASKRFLLDFSYALGQELKDENVSVLSLCPGGLPTTAEAIRGIEAQGFWGTVTTNKLEKVAHNTVSRVLRGRKLYIPGGLNRLFSIVSRFVPAQTIATLLLKRWSKAQKKRPATDFA